MKKRYGYCGKLGLHVEHIWTSNEMVIHCPGFKAEYPMW